jgi:hypothetical protein
LAKSSSSVGELPRYFQRMLKSMDTSPAIVEVVIRDCPKDVTVDALKATLPIVTCTITKELVTVYMRKEDVIDHIIKKQLKQVPIIVHS